MNNPVGYLLKKSTGLEGERGICYDYVMSGNGVWVEAEGPMLAARVPASYGTIRGLAPNELSLVLRHGLIPHELFELAFNIFLSDKTREWYTAITWGNGYHIVQPGQQREGASVVFDNPEKVVLDLHSHNVMAAGFSGTDNNDEQGLKLYGVVGRLDKEPELALRVGVYGHFAYLDWKDVFDGEPTSVIMAGGDEIDEEPDAETQAIMDRIKNDPITRQLRYAMRAAWGPPALQGKPRTLREELGPNAYIRLPSKAVQPNREPSIGQPKPWWHWPFGRKKLPPNTIEGNTCHTE